MTNVSEIIEHQPAAIRPTDVPQRPAGSVSKKLLWTGRVISGLIVVMLLFSAVLKLMRPAMVVEEFNRLGYAEHLALGLGIVETACAVVYAVPRTSVLGAILLTGYLGGATATHVRIGDPFISPVVVGVLVWLGVYLRDRRLRVLLPLRSRMDSGMKEIVS